MDEIVDLSLRERSPLSRSERSTMEKILMLRAQLLA